MIHVLIDDRQTIKTLDHERIRSVAKTAVEALDTKEAELSVLLVDDAGIQAMNARYLGRDRPTNVIAFPMKEGDFGDVTPGLLGDVVVSVETAVAEAATAGSDMSFMMDFFLVHGILHLFGFDHEGDAAEAEAMGRRQDEIMALIKRSGKEIAQQD